MCHMGAVALYYKGGIMQQIYIYIYLKMKPSDEELQFIPYHK